MSEHPDPIGELRDLIACPACRADLKWGAPTARCARCRRSYDVLDGIPRLIAPSGETQAGQNGFFDEQVDAGFEITRPQRAPALYGWLLSEKIRRSVAGLEGLLRGRTVLSICAGSGMDAEFLARAGAFVIAADLSLGAARRAKQRADRHQLAIVPVVADACRLPFRDRSVDVVYVHDGLHHLEDPLAGLAEMTRVAAAAVSVNEPARAAVTKLAIRIGVAGEYEDAGNRVARMSVGELRETLQARGFSIVHAERYGMFYRHEPKGAMRAFSRRRLLALAQASVLTGNALAGGIGNKLSVQAVRTEAPR